LLDILEGFFKDNNTIPTIADFSNNSRYPSFKTYYNRFGSWNNALGMVFDVNKGKKERYSREHLLSSLKQFYHNYGKIPVARDFVNNPEYPGLNTFQSRFGSFQKALKLVGLDVDSMIKKGIIETCQQKARLAEIKVIDHFEQHPIDLAGENCNSSCDGICPNGMNYDVKSSRLIEHHGSLYYQFGTDNKHKDDIEIYYFLAFNEDYTKLKYAWRVPGEIVENSMFYIGTSWSKFNIENMKEYEIADKINKIIDTKHS